MARKINQAFIVGTGRCGTSWLGQMLNSHAEVCVPPEIQLLFEVSGNGNRLFEQFSNIAPMGLEGDKIAAVIEKYCPHKLENFFDYKEFCLRKNTPRDSLKKFVQAFYSEIAIKHGKSWLIEQTPWYGLRLDLIAHFFPNAKIIHVIRDGRDVALSYARTPWWHLSPKLNLARWAREIKKITLDAGLYLTAGTYLEVKYEDLVANTESEIRRICNFLGINFDPVMLDPRGFIDYDVFCKFDMQEISSQAYSKWMGSKKKAAFSGSVQAWRKSQDMFQSPFTNEIISWLTHYEYEVDLNNSIHLNAPDYLPEYDLNSLEGISQSQLEQISSLDQMLQKQSENTELVTKDWIARGEQMEQLAHTNETLTEMLQKQSENTELVTKDWIARGEQMEQLAHTNRELISEVNQFKNSWYSSISYKIHNFKK